MTVIAPPSVTSTILSIIRLVPASNAPISNTPIGPFQTIVFDFAMAASLSSMDFGPMSRPRKPSGTPLSRSPFWISPSSPNLELHTKSTGNTISTPFFFAFSMIPGTSLEPGSSKRDAPISQPCTFRKVKAMPPPMTMMSTLSKRLSINWILSDTLAPPRIAHTGLPGVSRTLTNASSSLASRKPEHFVAKPSPTIELWARCAVPKASLQ
mmetsp:Transcript_73480/g.195277  ORF Transcript_73480/g.195277 Transcript_73480/m.195277 type:complete len:210 (-) Transcript_73480:862-1491(-)